MVDYLKLTKDETFNIVDKINNHYSTFNDIETYYRYKKKKRLENLPSSLSLFGVGPENDLFNFPLLFYSHLYVFLNLCLHCPYVPLTFTGFRLLLDHDLAFHLVPLYFLLTFDILLLA